MNEHGATTVRGQMDEASAFTHGFLESPVASSLLDSSGRTDNFRSGGGILRSQSRSAISHSYRWIFWSALFGVWFRKAKSTMRFCKRHLHIILWIGALIFAPLVLFFAGVEFPGAAAYVIACSSTTFALIFKLLR